MMNYFVIDKIIIDALKEDITSEDITTNSVVEDSSLSEVDLIVKEDGIIAGLPVFSRVFYLLKDVEVTFFKQEGATVKKGEKIALIKGNTRKILMGERVALNLLQRMSGIATLTNRFVSELKGTNTRLLDTRKTTPNLRILEKYAVRVGGGVNHRYNLSDGILLKDNHIAAAGGVKLAVEKARENCPFVRKIEVEVESLEMLKEALAAKADIIMLDNMDLETMKKAVAMTEGNAQTEASGNMSLDRIRKVALTGVDFISVGALTHSAEILDLSMKNLREIKP